MKKVEVFVLSIAVFLTIASWVIIDIYHIQQKINQQIGIKPAQVPDYQMDQKVIELIKAKSE